MINKDFRVFPVFKVVDGNCSCGSIDCNDQGKHPKISGWRNRSMYLDSMDFNNNNYGIPTGVINRLIVIDVDPRNGGAKSFQELEEKIGPLDATWIVETPGGGIHVYYEYNEAIKTSHGKLGAGIDLQAENAYVLSVDSNHLKGTYKWREGYSPEDLPLEVLPEKLLELLEHKEEIIEPIKQSNKLTDSKFKEIELALDLLECTSYQQWIDCGMALHSISGRGDKPLELWDAWSQKDDRYKSFDEIKHKWNSFKAGTITSTWIFAELKRQGHRPELIKVEPEVKLPDFDKVLNNVVELPKPEKPPTYFNKLPPGRAGELVQVFHESLDMVPLEVSIFAASQMIPTGVFQGLVQTPTGGTISSYGIITGRQGAGKSRVINAIKAIIASINDGVNHMQDAVSGTALLKNLIEKKNGNGILFQDEMLHALNTLRKKASRNGDTSASSLLSFWQASQDFLYAGQDAIGDEYTVKPCVGPVISMFGGGISSDWINLANDHEFMSKGFGSRLEVVEWGKLLHKSKKSGYSFDKTAFEEMLVPTKSLYQALTKSYSRENRKRIKLDGDAEILLDEFHRKCVDHDNASDVHEPLSRSRLYELSLRTASRIASLNAHAINGKIEGLHIDQNLMQWSINYVDSRYSVMFDNAEKSISTDESIFIENIKKFIRKHGSITKDKARTNIRPRLQARVRNEILQNLLDDNILRKTGVNYHFPSLKKLKP